MAPAFDTSQVSPSDAAVMLRSLRRRYAEVLGRPDLVGAAADPLHRRPPGGGLSPVEHAAWTAAALAATGKALHRVLRESNPDVALPPVDVAPTVDGGDLSPEDVVARVGDAADALAGTVAAIHGADWTQPARSRDATVTALDIARLAVRIAVEHLRAAERAVAQLDRTPEAPGD